MQTQTGRTARSETFRTAIAGFMAERREAKQKTKELDADAAAKYEYGAWLADAARRVSQIQAVTHVLKATHPDARGSNLRVASGSLPVHDEIGTHTLGTDVAEDVVGNAAALDVFKFLKLDVEGRRLLDWMQAGDDDLAHALHDDEATARGWMAAFSALVRQGGQPASHEMAKQVYWHIGGDPADDSQYHLLMPLFSSSLTHAVHAEIQDARFGEANQAARKARRDKAPHEGVNREYLGLVARKLGGTKPQNISQLNSERGGVNYLLASLPPYWASSQVPRLLGRKSAFGAFGGLPEVRMLVKELAGFLKTDPDPVRDTRRRREAIEQALSAQLQAFAEGVHDAFEPGWTRDAACELPEEEQLWLDPGRAEAVLRGEVAQDDEADEAFARAYQWGDWPDQVVGRFGLWLNARLSEAGLLGLGEAEYKHWARQAVAEVSWPVPMQRRAPQGAAV